MGSTYIDDSATIDEMQLSEEKSMVYSDSAYKIKPSVKKS